MKKRYTRKQIVEAINYWKKQLRVGNYKRLIESGDEYKYCLYYESYGNDNTVQIFDSMEELDKHFKEFLDGYFTVDHSAETGENSNATFWVNKNKTNIELSINWDNFDYDDWCKDFDNKKLPPEDPDRENKINKAFDLWKRGHYASFGRYDERYFVFIIKNSKLPELRKHLEKFPNNFATNTFYDIENEWCVKDNSKFRDKIIPQLCQDGGKDFGNIK